MQSRGSLIPFLGKLTGLFLLAVILLIIFRGVRRMVEFSIEHHRLKAPKPEGKEIKK